jgi:hypothetical protein
VVVQQVVLPLHLTVTFLIFMPAVDLGRSVDVFCKVVLVLFFLFILRLFRV